MSLLKRQGPVALCFVLGVLFFLQFYVPHRASQEFLATANDWASIAGGFTIALGLWSLFHLHATKIQRKVPGWGYSVVTFAGLVGAFAACMRAKSQSVGPDGLMSSQGWVIQYVFTPVNATMFATLGFYVASAAFRTFRLKSLESGILMAAALILVFGRVPLGEHLWSQLWHGGLAYDPWMDGARPNSMSAITDWIMSVPGMAGKRGIMFGIVLGSIATALKIILGIERAYLGGDKD